MENPTIRELLDRAAKELAPERIDASFPNQPLIQAEILHTVGKYVSRLWESTNGQSASCNAPRPMCTSKTSAPRIADTLDSMNRLGEAYRAAGKRDLALPLFKRRSNSRKPSSAPKIPTRS